MVSRSFGEEAGVMISFPEKPFQEHHYTLLIEVIPLDFVWSILFKKEYLYIKN
jgi:hypothetical protein